MKNILIIEDDTDIRESLQSLLEVEGYRVLSAANGRLGLDYLVSNPQFVPHLIILDLLMPVMGGKEFIDHHQNHAELSRIPVIILSALKHPETLMGHSCIKKPIEIDELLKLVRQYCD